MAGRTLLVAGVVATAVVAQGLHSSAHAEEGSAVAAASEPADPSLTEYVNAKQQYRLLVPAAWEAKGKAGADVLFEDPSRRSTSLGITVNPVKVASIEQFGGLQDVGDKLLDAERKKESTLGVTLLGSSSRTGATGATLYEYEYELDSTRGRKRILNTVTIFSSRLYILNAAFKCDKDGCSEEAQRGVALLRRLAGSFDVTTN
ncbi:hypothetical protein GPECTOR_2g1171 [Gonium pectorale]|uniref:PsbP C-terminal domain-containing protein n=1 Tax=Gonium pectorale TaxID=33097 RepID=A0A150H0K9_GONPE|nr:hypothetical protein GPECTOR_2g1171 [Gonium pectorale]|eukprot:KXZ55621.1 hypothetical protein GPECTOR_2g1171 [Gonium pectorale]